MPVLDVCVVSHRCPHRTAYGCVLRDTSNIVLRQDRGLLDCSLPEQAAQYAALLNGLQVCCMEQFWMIMWNGIGFDVC